MQKKAARRQVTGLAKPPNNPTHQPRNDGFRWNISTIGAALNLHRDTVRAKLRTAGIEPDGHVGNSPVYKLSRAIPAIYGHEPRAPKR